MTLHEYYNIIKSKIESKDFTIKVKSKNIKITKEDCIKQSHIESIHYLLYEFLDDNKDKRKFLIFNYVCVPNGVNKKDCDIDFTQWDIDTFLTEVMKLKDRKDTTNISTKKEKVSKVTEKKLEEPKKETPKATVYKKFKKEDISPIEPKEELDDFWN